MRISVVVILFNLEEFVGEAIESVLAQTRKADEIIVVNDCSTDGSSERVKAYGDSIRYLRMSENSGALLAALHGVKAASGDVICMLDADDYWSTDKLQVVEREFFADSDLMLLSHHHVRVDEKGVDLRIEDETHRNIASVRRRARSPEHLSDLLKETILQQRGYWLGSAYAFRKSALDIPKFETQIAGFGSERLRKTYLDLVVAPFLVLTNPLKTVGYTPDTRFWYRVHDKGSLGGNVTAERALQSVDKGRTTNQLIELILRKNGASPVDLRRRRLILQEYEFLSALYSRHYLKAVRLYAQLAVSHWNRRQLTKETKRLAAVLILGRDRFLSFRNKNTSRGKGR